MSPTPQTSAHELSASEADERDNVASERVAPEPSSPDEPRVDSKAKLACVLAGAAISQLPIWGFAMSYGIFQEYYQEHWTLEGDKRITGIIGTTQNGVMYLSMPFLFGLFTRRWARWRQPAAMCGMLLAGLGFLLSSFSRSVLHLVLTQGVVAALGCALMYSPMTLSLGEWYDTHNRAVAFGIALSAKNITGSACPYLFQGLLEHFGFRNALRIWMGILMGTGLVAILMVPVHPSRLSMTSYRARKIPWSFMRHSTIYIYCVAIITQSAGYGIPQSYINSYARATTSLSTTYATLLLVLFNVPGIASSSFFGYLSDNKRFSLSAATTTALSALSSAAAVFLFWGLTTRGSVALLVLFSLTFGFFSSGYSACWGGVLNQMEREARERNEPVDSGLVYGLLNGVRGIGYVAGGLAAIPLLGTGIPSTSAKYAYGTSYGPLIIFTGIVSAVGGWGILWRSKKFARALTSCCERGRPW